MDARFVAGDRVFEITRGIAEMMPLILCLVDGVDEQPAFAVRVGFPFGKAAAIGRRKRHLEPGLRDIADARVEREPALEAEGVALAQKFARFSAASLGENNDAPFPAQVGPSAVELDLAVEQPAKRSLLVFRCRPKAAIKID